MKSIRRDSDSSLIEATLSCLIAISSPRRVKLNLIREKLIKDLTKLLTDPTTASVSMTEKSLKLLESLASTKEGRSENCGGDGECLKTVVKKLMKVSTAVTEHAVTVIWSVSYLFTDPQKALEAVTSTNGVTKILLLYMNTRTINFFLLDDFYCFEFLNSCITYIPDDDTMFRLDFFHPGLVQKMF
ncbi:unnamed protein product [Brassica rapa subsp. narinosa]